MSKKMIRNVKVVIVGNVVKKLCAAYLFVAVGVIDVVARADVKLLQAEVDVDVDVEVEIEVEVKVELLPGIINNPLTKLFGLRSFLRLLRGFIIRGRHASPLLIFSAFLISEQSIFAKISLDLQFVKAAGAEF
ncbi:hypothetical protein GQX74_006404 [Glossina fuscipes]|nr:hypothetical protein GQX74_006404 [Glossina fuscipes]